MAGNDVGFRDHVVLGTFSTDEDMNYCNDQRNRRFFVEPDDRPNFDLLHGIDDYVDRGDHDDRDHSVRQPTPLTPVLKWIRDHQKELKEKGIMKPAGKGPEMKMDVDFVARRGLLMNLLRAAKDVQGVGLLVTRYNGTYYLEGMGRRRQAEVPNCPREIGGETVAERKDAVELPPMNYVDVKTYQALSERRLQSNFEKYGTLRWWSMNHISGVSDIVVGWRDDRRNVVTSTEMMRTEDLPSKAAGWDPASCVSRFLSFVKDIREKIPDDDPSAVYCMGLNRLEISRDTWWQLKERRLSFSRKEDDYVILKDWYLRDVLKVPE
ncbi:decapping and exoribonuclease protein-like [Diadema antillarum]|uniref:decapping and exoribonuclease protein-like n=1 Tax=Diadema antillarum TaxID=105358 RepID=UPI003A870919